MINGIIHFLAKLAENDVKPDFLIVHAPENKIFSDRVIRGFQLRLLEMELNKAKAKKTNLHAISEISRSGHCWSLIKKLHGSVALNIRLSIRLKIN